MWTLSRLLSLRAKVEMRGAVFAVIFFAVLFSRSAVAEETSLLLPGKAPAEGALPQISQNDGKQGSAEGNTTRRLEASLELRRLYAEESRKSIPHPKGFPALLAGMGLLGHAGLQGWKYWDTIAVPKPAAALILGKARLDTINLGLYSFILGLFFFLLGVRRRWNSHKERSQKKLEDMLQRERAAAISQSRGRT